MLPFEFFFPKFGKGQIVPLAVFLRDNFNCSAELAQWRGLAQTLYGIGPFSAIFFIVSPVFNYENSNLALLATQKVPDVSRHSGR